MDTPSSPTSRSLVCGVLTVQWQSQPRTLLLSCTVSAGNMQDVLAFAGHLSESSADATTPSLDDDEPQQLPTWVRRAAYPRSGRLDVLDG